MFPPFTITLVVENVFEAMANILCVCVFIGYGSCFGGRYQVTWFGAGD